MPKLAKTQLEKDIDKLLNNMIFDQHIMFPVAFYLSGLLMGMAVGILLAKAGVL